MKIAVIGAGISGLTAGRILAKTGHQVVVFEEKTDFGGRMATVSRENSNIQIDYGIPYFTSADGEFGKLLDELKEKNLLAEWKGNFSKVREGSIYDTRKKTSHLIATKGMSSIGKYLGRMLDIRMGTKVGGLTHIGAHRTKKRSWMLNFPTALTENFDAVIIATPAKQAYAILNTTIDETETLKLVREIDDVEYSSQFTIIAGYKNGKIPEWNALECEDDVISWVSNESRKTENPEEGVFVVHSTSAFAQKNRDEEQDRVAEKIMKRLSEFIGEGWVALPDWQQVHFWKYSKVINPLSHSYLEIDNKETPLALIGGYMNGDDIESAYLSGFKLGHYWADKYAG